VAERLNAPVLKTGRDPANKDILDESCAILAQGTSIDRLNAAWTDATAEERQRFLAQIAGGAR